MPPLRRDAQVIILIGLAHATSHFFHLILAPLFVWLKHDFSLSYGELGLLMTVFFLVSGCGQAAAGFIVDRYGAFPVHIAGLSLLCISALGMAASPNYDSLLFFEGVAGLGNCVFHPSGFTILNKRVTERNLSHAFSVHGVSGTLGWAVAPVFLAGLATLTSWRMALLAAALMAFVVLVVFVSFRGILDPHEAHSDAHFPFPHGAGMRATFVGVLHLMGIPGIWMCFMFFLITAMSSGGIQSFAPTALRDLYHVPVTLASACITAYMLANAVGMVWGGFLAKRFARYELIIALAFGTSGLIAAVVGSGIVPSALTIVLLAVIGLGAGISGPSRDLLVRASAPKNATGRVYGLVYSGLDIGLSLAPLLFGALMDHRQPAWVFIFIGIFQSLALLTVFGIERRRE